MKKNYLMAVCLFLVVMSGCGNKEQSSQQAEPVKVKVMTVVSSVRNETVRFSGTVQEENGCNGVDALDAGKLKSRRMIGLDVMGETVEYTSCVSCFTSDLMKLTKTCETEPAKGAALMLTVSGVQPVHSGAMVHPEQFNAIKITARLLNALSENGAVYRLSTMAGG